MSGQLALIYVACDISKVDLPYSPYLRVMMSHIPYNDFSLICMFRWKAKNSDMFLLHFRVHAMHVLDRGPENAIGWDLKVWSWNRLLHLFSIM